MILFPEAINSPGMGRGGGEDKDHVDRPHRLLSLEKQLNIELKVITMTYLTADPGVSSSISALSHTFAEIDWEIISTARLLASADSRRVISYKGKYVHKVLVNCLVKLAQENKGCWVNSGHDHSC